MGRTEVLLVCQAQFLLDALSKACIGSNHKCVVHSRVHERIGSHNPCIAEVVSSPRSPLIPWASSPGAFQITLLVPLSSTPPHIPASQLCHPFPNHQPHLPLEPQPAMKLAQVFIHSSQFATETTFSLPIAKIIPSPPVLFFSSVWNACWAMGHLPHRSQPTRSYNTSQLRKMLGLATTWQAYCWSTSVPLILWWNLSQSKEI